MRSPEANVAATDRCKQGVTYGWVVVLRKDPYIQMRKPNPATCHRTLPLHLATVQTRHTRRYKPSAEELATAEQTPTTAHGDRETGQASRENGQIGTEASGAAEQPATEDAEDTRAASPVKGQIGSKKSRGNADSGQATELRGDEEDDQHKFSEWKVHPRWTPRKDTALQVNQYNLPTTYLPVVE